MIKMWEVSVFLFRSSYPINIKLFPIEGVLAPQVHVLCCLKSNCHKTAITTRSLNIENSNKNTASAIYLLYFNYLMHKNDIKLHTSCHKVIEDDINEVFEPNKPKSKQV